MKLVTVQGDSGLHLFCYVGGCGLKIVFMFYINGCCRKGSFCHRPALVWCDVEAMVCCSCPCHCYLCPSSSLTPTSFPLIPPPSPPSSISDSPLSPHPLSLSFSQSLSLSLDLFLYISLMFSLMSECNEILMRAFKAS